MSAIDRSPRGGVERARRRLGAIGTIVWLALDATPASAQLPVRAGDLNGRPFYNGVRCVGAPFATGDIVPSPGSYAENVIVRIERLRSGGFVYFGTTGTFVFRAGSPTWLAYRSERGAVCADGFRTPARFRDQRSLR